MTPALGRGFGTSVGVGVSVSVSVSGRTIESATIQDKVGRVGDMGSFRFECAS